MIVTELYNGQGLGNQLWCYCVLRTIAMDNCYEFGIQSPEKFKAPHFMNLDFGNSVFGGIGPEGGPPSQLPNTITNYFVEPCIRHNNGSDIRPYCYEMTKIPDNTKIDGICQSEKYIEHRKQEIIKWLTPTRQILDYSDDDICVIHFRGGDYKFAGQTLLPMSYYTNAINYMKEINNNMRFVVITDDLHLASQYFSGVAQIVGSSVTQIRDNNQADFHIGGDLSVDYSILNNAKHMIISNSSFSWWSCWTNTKVKTVIAPKYWAAFNFSDGYWSCGDSLTKHWTWLDRTGNSYTYEECLSEL